MSIDRTARAGSRYTALCSAPSMTAHSALRNARSARALHDVHARVKLPTPDDRHEARNEHDDEYAAGDGADRVRQFADRRLERFRRAGVHFESEGAGRRGVDVVAVLELMLVDGTIQRRASQRCDGERCPPPQLDNLLAQLHVLEHDGPEC